MIWKLEFNWEKSPINILPLALENYQVLRENVFMNTISFQERDAWDVLSKFRTLLRSFHYYLAYSWAFFCVCGVHSDGDLVWILFTNKSTTLSFSMVVDSTALAMKLLKMKRNLEKMSPLCPSSSNPLTSPCQVPQPYPLRLQPTFWWEAF